jgi:choline dehydrogenase-like flavoprotein
MPQDLTDVQRDTLRVLCDTVVPRIERPHDPDGFWARTATDLRVEEQVEELVGQLPDDLREGFMELLDGLEAQGLRTAPSQLSREQILRTMSLVSSEAAAGVSALAGMTLFLTYGGADAENGQNPNWRTFGYPGPGSPPPGVPKPIQPLVPDSDAVTLEADVCVVGSGAGGGVIAGTLAERGMRVIVLEAGGYFNESDFAQVERKAYEDMYWRGGPTPTADGNITLQAGTTLGGGTVVNWTNCLRTPPWVREQWARQHGLEGLDGPEYDRHLDAVLDRISATDAHSDLNGPQQRMLAGCQRLGWSFKTVVRNTDSQGYTPESAAYMGFGDQSGAKQSVDKTFLRDAVANGAEVLVRTHAERVLVENGRAVGVQATYDDQRGKRARVTVHARCVVIACGSLESPALLLRSHIGGRAVGYHLRLHPSTATFGIYAEDMRAWWGAPHAGLCDEFANTGEGYGFLIEGAQYAPGITGTAVPWSSARLHKQVMEKVRYGATFIALLRDHGHGQVTIDRAGQAVPTYAVTDELDLRNMRHGLEVQIRLHAAAGALEVYSLGAGLPTWRRGEDLEPFIARAQRVPMRAGGQRLFSAHQMGTCRMGRDRRTSVAGPWGELHDVKGVWIGDGSAFPTASGTNPMVSIMALAHRTSEAIAGARAELAAARAPAATPAPVRP